MICSGTCGGGTQRGDDTMEMRCQCICWSKESKISLLSIRPSFPKFTSVVWETLENRAKVFGHDHDLSLLSKILCTAFIKLYRLYSQAVNHFPGSGMLLESSLREVIV
jgi:hypothetical protein